MITTKKGALEYTQKEMRKEFKHFTTEKSNIKEMRSVEEAIRHIENK